MATLTRDQVIEKAIKAAEQITSKMTGIPEDDLVRYLVAVAHVESKFDTNAKNRTSSARGLTQVLINSQRWIEGKLKLPQQPAMMKASQYPKAPVTAIPEEDSMFSPDYAMLIGCWYLAYNYGRYNNWYKAITAYHLGSYVASSKDGQDYKAKVLASFKDLKLGQPIVRSVNNSVPVRIIVAEAKTYMYKENY